MRVLTLMLSAAALAFSTPSWAQTLFKSFRADGSVEYSDKPPRDAVRVERYELVPSEPQDAGRAAKQRAADSMRLREFEAREHKREVARERADAELNAALAALQQAQQRLDAGVEPEPGENIGTARGFVRRNDRYYERLQRLSDAVASAQRRLDRAYAARNALRD